MQSGDPLPTAAEPAARLHRGTAAAIGLLLPAAALFCFCRLYSSFAPYDDEGYIQLSLSMYREHGALYDQVISQYGPAYYVLSDGLHTLTGLPVTHDVARLKTLIAWLLASGLSGVLISQLTHRATLGVLAAVSVLFHLDRLGWEPGHPQELAVLMILGCLWVGVRWDAAAKQRQWRSVVWLGALCGTLAMTKLNLGGLTGIACLATLLMPMLRQRIAGWLWGAMALFGMLLPLALAKSQVWSWAGFGLPAAVIAGWSGVWLHRRQGDDDGESDWRLAGIFMASAAVTGMAWVGAALSDGTSWHGLWHGLIGQHQGFLNLFYHHAPLPAGTLAASLLGVGAALMARRERRIVSIIQWTSVAILLLVSLRAFGETWQPIRHGLGDRAAAGFLAGCVTPFCWVLIAVPAHQGAAGDGRRFPIPARTRQLLGFLVVVQPLGAYPTPGTQMAVGTLATLLMLYVVVGDLLTRLESSVVPSPLPVRPMLRFAVALAALTVVCRDVEAVRAWRSAEPLGLTGAQWMRLPASEAAEYRETVDLLRSRADTFVATPTGLCSLYLWSGIAPPTSYNTTYWETLLSAQQQQAVIVRLESVEHPCLVVDRRQPPVRLSDAPLNRYLEQRFTQRQSMGQLEVWCPESAAEISIESVR